MHNGAYHHVLLLAPTGKTVEVPMREGAGDTGLTIATALQSLREDALQSKRPLVVVDEAGMAASRTQSPLALRDGGSELVPRPWTGAAATTGCTVGIR